MNGFNITPDGVMGVSDHNGSPPQMILPTITHYELLRDRPLLMVFPNNYEYALRIMNYKLSIIMLKNIYPH